MGQDKQSSYQSSKNDQVTSDDKKTSDSSKSKAPDDKLSALKTSKSQRFVLQVWGEVEPNSQMSYFCFFACVGRSMAVS
jgi:hypothetical protein